jgi:hypothetical protein
MKGYCQGRPGHLFVKKGDYQMIRTKDSRTIDPFEFAGVVEPDMMFEMSIVLRRRMAFQDNKGKWPKCAYVNDHQRNSRADRMASAFEIYMITIDVSPCSRRCFKL